MIRLFVFFTSAQKKTPHPYAGATPYLGVQASAHYFNGDFPEDPLEIAYAYFPPGEGWEKHQVNYAEVPPDVIEKIYLHNAGDGGK